MELIRPCEKFLKQHKDAVNEDKIYRSNKESIYMDSSIIVKQAYNNEHGINLLPGYVKDTRLWLVDEDKFIGEVDIRHELNDFLMNYGGHIGYEIRYSECNKGYGKKILNLALKFAKNELKLKNVLVTCDDDNIASIKIIEGNGGKLENKVKNIVKNKEIITRRYWIKL